MAAARRRRRHLVRVELVLDESEHERALAHVAVAQLRSGRRGRVRQRQWWWPCAGCTTLALHGCGARTSTSLHSVTRPRGAPAAAGLRSATVRGFDRPAAAHLPLPSLQRGHDQRPGTRRRRKSFLTEHLHLIAVGVQEKDDCGREISHLALIHSSALIHTHTYIYI